MNGNEEPGDVTVLAVSLRVYLTLHFNVDTSDSSTWQCLGPLSRDTYRSSSRLPAYLNARIAWK
jgi:hypothetical protein